MAQCLLYSIKPLNKLNLFYSQNSVQAEETATKEQGVPTPASPLTSETKGNQNQNQALLTRLQLLASEHQTLQTQLCRSQDAEREASEKVQK